MSGDSGWQLMIWRIVHQMSATVCHLATLRVLCFGLSITIISTILMYTGIDAEVNRWARLQSATFSLIWSAPAMLAGMITPIIIPIWLGYRGYKNEAQTIIVAVILTLFLVTLLKAFTGRISPEALLPVDLLQRSQSLQFGFLQGGVIEGIFEGWPSGHAATNTAIAVALWSTTKSGWLRLSMMIWAIWVTLATVFGIRGDVHWLSDSVAGAAYGSIIGFTAANVHKLYNKSFQTIE